MIFSLRSSQLGARPSASNGLGIGDRGGRVGLGLGLNGGRILGDGHLLPVPPTGALKTTLVSSRLSTATSAADVNSVVSRTDTALTSAIRPMRQVRWLTHRRACFHPAG